MSKWNKVKLSEVCTVNPPKKQLQALYENKVVSFIPMSEVTEDGRVNTNNKRSYSEVSSGFTYFAENDVLFAKITPCMENGKGGIARGLINGLGVGSTEFHVLRPNIENVTSDWIFRFVSFSKFRKLAKKNMTGSAGQRRVPKAFLENVFIPLPPLETQKQIAKTLDTASELLAMRKQQLAELDNLIKSTFYDMFGDPFENPKGWNMCQLSDLASIIMGQSPNGSSYNEEGEGTPLLNGPTEFGDKYPTEKQWTLEPTKMCQKDDILFCVRGATAGRMNISDKEYCIGRGLAAIRPKQYNMQGFIYLYLQMMYSHLQSTSNGSTFINISKDQLYKLPYMEVDNKIQEKFSNIFTKIEEQKALVKRAIDETQYLFDSLMSEYFE